ncbi:acyl-CoA mutase large subunit family protein [Ectobacillus ponti]|uniref:Acyl-CoA mutase large subunit family protein n=1 Tax=Ectobacillus ponti TaxID=2961894 RepID=A0AA41X544_9BACI|nr:acyl-CoA mutase large subunit family protein [Ectobacillus ponti]MCP8967025.1 acyl-CoA mutase large subunit family protein [Ectobacillus ponti]
MEKNTFREFAGADHENWRRLAEKTLKGKPFSSIITDTYEHIALQPLYTREHAEGKELEAAVHIPKERHTVAQELAAYAAPEMQYKLQHALETGQEVLNLPLDKATRAGLDSDTAGSGEVLRGGIALNSLEDFESALKEVDLAKHPLLVYAGYTALPLVTGLAAYAKQRGAKWKGTVGADPLGVLASTGKLPVSLEAAYDSMAAAIVWTGTHAPEVRTVFVSINACHRAGAHAVQELAAALATAAEYVRALLGRGVSADAACSSITFGFSAGPHLFTEIAKLRAIRVLWSKIAESFGAGREAQRMQLHVRTSERTKTMYDPHVNLLRATTEAFAALVGGADTLHVGTYDEAYGGGDENGERWARNIQHILREESHLLQVVDPARGSYYVEALTSELAKQAWELFQTIEAKGGMHAVLQQGWLQREIAETAKRRRYNVMSLKQRIVGTNMYVKKDEVLLKESAKPAEQQQRRILEVIKYKEQRNADVLRQALPQSLTLTASDTPDVLEQAWRAGATIGELIALFPQGEEQVQPLPVMRDAEPFEVLREAAERYEQRTGRRPQADILRLNGEKVSPLLASALEACGYNVRQALSEPNAACAEAGANAVFLAGNEEAQQEAASVLAAAGLQAKLFVIGAYGDAEVWRQLGVHGCVNGPDGLLPYLYELHNELEVTV